MINLLLYHKEESLYLLHIIPVLPKQMQQVCGLTIEKNQILVYGHVGTPARSRVSIVNFG